MQDELRTEEAIQNQLLKYAIDGVLNPDGYIKPVAVDLNTLYPKFINEIVPLCEGKYNVESEFLKYLYTSHNGFSVKGKGEECIAEWFPGRLVGDKTAERPLGPYSLKPVDVMIITQQMFELYSDDSVDMDIDLSPLSIGVRDFLLAVAESVGFSRKEISKWYMTSLVKFQNPNPDYSVPADWIKGTFPWILQEIYLLKPKVIICVGAPVAKKFLGTSATIVKTNGLLIPTTISINDGIEHQCDILTLPAFSAKVDLDMESNLRRQLTLVYNKLKDIKPKEIETKHVLANCAKDLQHDIDRIKRKAKKNPRYRIIAVDLEWEGEYPEQEGAHVLTVQFSAFPGEATVVPLYDSKGVAFKEGVDVAVKLLNSLLTPQDDWKPRLGGHFLRADMPWLIHLGINEIGLKHAYQPAKTYKECRDEGGWDTGLAYHAYRDAEEIGDGYGLKVLAMKECGIARYETQLVKEYNDYAHCNKIRQEAEDKLVSAKAELSEIKSKYKTKKSREENKALIDSLKEKVERAKEELKSIPTKIKPKGFGCISEKTLYTYAAWDADATRRLIELCFYGDEHRKALLDDDGYGNSSWEPFWRAHRASWGFGEMERTGFLLDIDRLANLSILFVDAYNAMLQKFRDDFNWSDFNPNSSDQRRGLLFGREFSKKKDGTYAMPEDALSMNLEPIRATDKTAWESIDDEDMDSYSASTDSLSLSILAQKHPEARMFKDICKLGRTLAGNIRPPVFVPNGNDTVITWDKGIYTYLRPDNHVHTHLSQTKKTGRASSYDPPMQNIGKSAEALLQTTLGYRDKDGEVIANYPELFSEPRYLYPCRTILRADPGNVLIESDFTGAELAVMAWASGDTNMIEHVRRNALPEDDPDFYDIHSHIAVKAFHLDCEPTKKGLASIHKKHLRVAAKAVVFGIP